jgi:hypothetical protein
LRSQDNIVDSSTVHHATHLTDAQRIDWLRNGSAPRFRQGDDDAQSRDRGGDWNSPPIGAGCSVEAFLAQIGVTLRGRGVVIS